MFNKQLAAAAMHQSQSHSHMASQGSPSTCSQGVQLTFPAQSDTAKTCNIGWYLQLWCCSTHHWRWQRPHNSGCTIGKWSAAASCLKHAIQV